MAPRSEVHIFGRGINNDYHVAGYFASAQQNIKLLWNSRWFLRMECKTGYVTLPDVFVRNNASPERANHNFSFIEADVAAGLYINWRRHGTK